MILISREPGQLFPTKFLIIDINKFGIVMCSIYLYGKIDKKMERTAISRLENKVSMLNSLNY